MPLDFVGRIEHMDEDWKKAGRQYCVKMGERSTETQKEACVGLQLLAPKFQESRNRKQLSEEELAASILSHEEVRRFCTSDLFGPALERPTQRFAMPFYNCTNPYRPRETNARRSFLLVPHRDD